MAEKLRVGITMGDFNGIGPEIILKTLAHPLVLNYCVPVVYGIPYVFKHYSKLLNRQYPDFHIADSADDLKDDAVNLRVSGKDKIEILPGTATEQAGKCAIDAIDLAIADVMAGKIHNLLTAPIDKQSISQSRPGFSGHTGYLAEQFDSHTFMILLDEELRVAMVTGHTALDTVSASLTEEKIVESLRLFNHSLQSDFRIPKPRLAVLGLNPHSGDGGLMGGEEQAAIAPAIAKAQEEGILAVGPYPPDGFFGSRNLQAFDAVLGMYHDQVLIPFKQIAFHSGVNYTAGLPIVRTSPDHGTAYDIAGKGEADITSFVNALFLINHVHRNRLAWFGGDEFLKFREHRREKFSIGIPDLKSDT